MVWGTGTPHREFLCSDDMADACVYLMEKCNAAEVEEFVNIDVGRDITIRELAELVARVVGFEGAFVFDTSKPNGTPRKLLDVTRLSTLGWQAGIALEDGVRAAYQDFFVASIMADESNCDSGEVTH